MPADRDAHDAPAHEIRWCDDGPIGVDLRDDRDGDWLPTVPFGGASPTRAPCRCSQSDREPCSGYLGVMLAVIPAKGYQLSADTSMTRCAAPLQD